MPSKSVADRNRKTPPAADVVAPSPNYSGINILKGMSLKAMLNAARRCFRRCLVSVNEMSAHNRKTEKKAKEQEISTLSYSEYITEATYPDFLTISEYTELIYYWLLINPNVLTVSEFYNYPLDFAPYLYDLTDVMKEGNEAIFCLLEERIQTAALHKQIDREVAMNLLREKYSWEKNNTQNVNLNTTGAVVDFQFGDANLNNPTSKTDNK